ncbi:UNVERIFIED_CONTAM: hypothetical protein GTU68_058839 [Idotea baltica]|nr:hypothetical protein [Idotea baltica]
MVLLRLASVILHRRRWVMLCMWICRK